MATQFTKEELKQAFNQMIDIIYEAREVQEQTPLSRLIKTTPIKQKHVDTRPSKSGSFLDTKKLLMSKKGVKGYEIDLDVLRDMYEAFTSLTNFTSVTDPKKSTEIMEGILEYNSTNVTGYGRVTEGQVYGLEAIGEELGYEPFEYLTDIE